MTPAFASELMDILTRFLADGEVDAAIEDITKLQKEPSLPKLVVGSGGIKVIQEQDFVGGEYTSNKVYKAYAKRRRAVGIINLMELPSLFRF